MGQFDLFGFLFFLLITLVIGLILRWQLAGVALNWATAWDLRRAHSHVGFYGVLFPAAWILLRPLGAWVPGARVLLVYVLLVALSTVGFLREGYGPLAIVTSTGILFIWLWFAWKNRPGRSLFKRDWMATSSLAVLFSALLIPLVASTTDSAPALANKMARTFLSLLLFGVFVPASWRYVARKPPHPIPWLIATVTGALYLTTLVPHWTLGFGLVWLSYEMLSSLLAQGSNGSSPFSFYRRLYVYWFVMAGALAVMGIGVVPYSYFLAIAGIHFLVLGPVLMTFAWVGLQLRPAWWLTWFYELSLITMVTAIALQAWWVDKLVLLQQVSAIAGSGILFATLLVALQTWTTARKTRAH